MKKVHQRCIKNIILMQTKKSIKEEVFFHIFHDLSVINQRKKSIRNKSLSKTQSAWSINRIMLKLLLLKNAKIRCKRKINQWIVNCERYSNLDQLWQLLVTGGRSGMNMLVYKQNSSVTIIFMCQTQKESR